MTHPNMLRRLRAEKTEEDAICEMYTAGGLNEEEWCMAILKIIGNKKAMTFAGNRSKSSIGISSLR